MAKMNVNLYVIEDYGNETTLRPKKTNPIKPNFTYPQRHTLSYAEGGKTEVRCRMSEVRYLSSASVHGHLLVNRMNLVFLGRMAVHFHNPFVKKRLRLFCALRKLGLFFRTEKPPFFL